MFPLIMQAVGNGEQTGPEAFFGFMGVACALVFANLGAAYGTAKSGVGISSMGVLKPDLIIRSVIPVVMAGILGIYGLIVSVILIQKSKRSILIYSHCYWIYLLPRICPSCLGSMLRS
jgi:ATP synthase proteolipid subunit